MNVYFDLFENDWEVNVYKWSLDNDVILTIRIVWQIDVKGSWYDKENNRSEHEV